MRQPLQGVNQKYVVQSYGYSPGKYTLEPHSHTTDHFITQLWLKKDRRGRKIGEN